MSAQVSSASGGDQSPLFTELQFSLATTSLSVFSSPGMTNEVYGQCETERSFKAAPTDVISNGNGCMQERRSLQDGLTPTRRNIDLMQGLQAGTVLHSRNGTTDHKRAYIWIGYRDVADF